MSADRECIWAKVRTASVFKVKWECLYCGETTTTELGERPLKCKRPVVEARTDEREHT